MSEHKTQARALRKRFIENLTYLREAHGLTQEEATSLLGCGLKRSTYGAWEEERGFPSPFFQLRLARIYGYSLEELYTTALRKKLAG